MSHDCQVAARRTGHQYDERWLDTSCGPLRVEVSGRGPVLVFIHGLLADGSAWDSVVGRLVGSHTCVVPDWPLGSHGRELANGVDATPRRIAALVPEVVELLNLDGVTLVANDGGGILGQLVMATDPPAIDSYVLMPCDTEGNCPPRLFQWMCWLAACPGGMRVLHWLARIPVARRLPLTYGWLSSTRLPNELTARWTKSLAKPGVRRDLRVFLRHVAATDLAAERHRLAAIARPVLVLWAAQDRVFPIERGRALAELIPGARLEESATGLTLLGIDEPDWVAEHISAFVAELTWRVGHVERN